MTKPAVIPLLLLIDVLFRQSRVYLYNVQKLRAKLCIDVTRQLGLLGNLRKNNLFMWHCHGDQTNAITQRIGCYIRNWQLTSWSIPRTEETFLNRKDLIQNCLYNYWRVIGLARTAISTVTMEHPAVHQDPERQYKGQSNRIQGQSPICCNTYEDSFESYELKGQNGPEGPGDNTTRPINQHSGSPDLQKDHSKGQGHLSHNRLLDRETEQTETLGPREPDIHCGPLASQRGLEAGQNRQVGGDAVAIKGHCSLQRGEESRTGRCETIGDAATACVKTEKAAEPEDTLADIWSVKSSPSAANHASVMLQDFDLPSTHGSEHITSNHKKPPGCDFRTQDAERLERCQSPPRCNTQVRENKTQRPCDLDLQPMTLTLKQLVYRKDMVNQNITRWCENKGQVDGGQKESKMEWVNCDSPSPVMWSDGNKVSSQKNDDNDDNTSQPGSSINRSSSSSDEDNSPIYVPPPKRCGKQQLMALQKRELKQDKMVGPSSFSASLTLLWYLFRLSCV